MVQPSEEAEEPVEPQSSSTCGEVLFDESSSAMHMKFIGNATAEGASAMLTKLLEELDRLPCRLVILDLSQASPWLSSGVRRMLSEKSKLVQADKQAIVVSNPVVRMLAKTMLVWLGPNRKMRFVKDIDEARAYINEQ